MAELKTEAKIQNLNHVMMFVEEALEKAGCGMKALLQISVALEEIFVNVAHYAYGKETGDVVVSVDIRQPDEVAVIRITDSGIPSDPLAKEDPDITLSADKRNIGGLGIFMVKQSMDHVAYEYKDGQNIFTMEKSIR